jgi:aspartyl protease family protein
MVSNGDEALSLIYLAGVLVLVVSALAVRRVPLGRTVKMAAAWLLIFAALFVVVALRDDFAALGHRVVVAARGSEQKGRELRIRKSEDGHFWVDGEVNGVAARFLVDSGATITSLSVATADSARVEHGGVPVPVETANGIARVESGEIDRLDVGPIERNDVRVHVSPGFGDTNVLGMNFLSSLAGWRVEGEWLVLKA